jgi:MscS family membrane protein
MKFNIGLKYDTPSDVMMKIAKEIKNFINSRSLVGEDTIVTFDTMGESALNIQVQYFIVVSEGADYAQIKEGINYQILKIVADNGAKFAQPLQPVIQDYRGEKPDENLQ